VKKLKTKYKIMALIAALVVLTFAAAHFIFSRKTGSSANKNKMRTSIQADRSAKGHNNFPAGKADKVVYLTIDDGPSSSITPKVLDILDKYDVRATFFLIGNNIKGNEAIVKRIYNEGDGIGLHSWTHNIKLVYSSEARFLNEMQETQDEIYKITGERPLIMRFPGGSFRRFNTGYIDKLHKMNYKIYDWNVSFGDGTYPHDTVKQLYDNATFVDTNKKSIIILMHCKPNNAASCSALPEVINFYRNHNYEFKVLNASTPEYYSKIRKQGN
jgi:peptidoglycan/xylan/chitin deacetylase (PgdA/CDA1 family)